MQTRDRMVIKMLKTRISGKSRTPLCKTFSVMVYWRRAVRFISRESRRMKYWYITKAVLLVR